MTKGKWTLKELKVGQVYETTFHPNPEEGGAFPWLSRHLDGRKAPKVVLCGDDRIRTGVSCQIRITAIRKPNRDDRGAIEVAYLRESGLELGDVYLDPKTSRQVRVLLESGLNILLDGPQGCGKTVLARSIAKALGMEFVFFNCGAVIESTDFLASLQVRANDEGIPETVFLKTDFLEGLERAVLEPEKRFLLFLDELNRARESARNLLMPALDHSRRIFNPVTGAFLDIPGNVQFIAAVNRGDSFTGTYGIDAAQLDRFAPIRMEYLPMEEEIRLLERRHPELKTVWIRSVVEIADALRNHEDLETGLSVRATEEVCVYMDHPIIQETLPGGMADLLKSSFCGRFNGHWREEHTDAGIAWGTIKQIIEHPGA